MTDWNLVLIDGTGLLYRAYFAIAHLSTRDGQPTNAVFGFIRMLKQVVRVWKPSHLVVMFDGGIPEKRLRLLQTYKAQRPPMPDPLRRQIPLAEEYLNRAGTAWMRIDGEEADDVLASVVTQARPGAKEEIIVTSDKDMFQLVDDRITVVRPSYVDEKMGTNEIVENTGVQPSQVAAWLALTGDSSDNIPGVPGVGPKTAAKLLAQYGSLDNLWRRVDEVKPDKLRMALASNRDLVCRNMELVRLSTDLDCGFTWDRVKLKPENPGELMPFFEKLEFHSLARELGDRSLPGLDF